MKSNTEIPLGGKAAMILAVICQFLVMLPTLLLVWQPLALSFQQHGFPNYLPISPFMDRLAFVLLAGAAVLGLATSRSWGWSLAVLLNVVWLSFLVWELVSRPLSPLTRWEPQEMIVTLVAMPVLLFPPVRTYYSRRTTPWILSWWAQPSNTAQLPREGLPWMILAIICQSLLVFPLLALVWRVLAESVQHGYPNDLPVFPFIVLLAFVLLAGAATLGLMMCRSWGWSLAVLLNVAGLSLLLSSLTLESVANLKMSRDARETIFTTFTAVAVAVLLLPPVRTYYSHLRTPWILSWWTQPLNTGVDLALVHLLALAHILVSVFWFLPTLRYPPGFVIFLPIVGFNIFAAVKLCSGSILGRLLVLGLCILGFVHGIQNWTAALAYNRFHAQEIDRTGYFPFFCAYCLMAGLYLLLTLIKSWPEVLEVALRRTQYSEGKARN